MIKRKLTLEERVTVLERKLKQMNEVGPLLAKVIPLVVKNLPLILNALKPLIDALSKDQINDNKDKIDVLTSFSEIGQKVIDMFNESNK